MELALECPSYLLGQVQPLVDFDWILTHLVLGDKVYEEWYRKSTNFKVLDNSVNELLEPCTLDDMLEASLKVGGVDLVVPPDFLGDSKKTIQALDDAHAFWNLDTLLPVVQGETYDEVLDCAFGYQRRGFDKIAVPYDSTCRRSDSRKKMAATRLQIVNGIIAQSPIGFKIHLLGFTTLDELARYNTGWVRSIDTGVPVLYGLHEQNLEDSWDFKKDKPTMSQMTVAPGGFLMDKQASIFRNIAYLRKVIND